MANPRERSTESTRPTRVLALAESVAAFVDVDAGAGGWEGTERQALSKKNTASGVSARTVLAFMRTAQCRRGLRF